MINILYHDNHTCRIEGASAAIGKQLRTITGSQWQRGSKCWLVPIGALGHVYRICGIQNVAIEYDVLVAFDESMQWMVAQYAACGIRIWLDGGTVRSDSELVAKLLQPRTQWLAPFLEATEPPRFSERVPIKKETSAVTSLDNAYIEGIKNAMRLSEREQYYGKSSTRRKRKRVHN